MLFYVISMVFLIGLIMISVTLVTSFVTLVTIYVTIDNTLYTFSIRDRINKDMINCNKQYILRIVS